MRLWNISRQGEATASLGSLFHSSVILTVKKFLLTQVRNCPCSS